MIWKTPPYTCNDPRDWEAPLILQYYNTSAWCMMRLAGCLGTYDSEPEDDLACLLLFRARSLSPCVRPFLSSSSLYCKTNKKQWRDKVVYVDFFFLLMDVLSKIMQQILYLKARASFQNSPVPFLLSWLPCSCCSHWWLCHPLQTESWLQPSCHSLVHLASSPGKHPPLPTDCSASWWTNFSETQSKLIFLARLRFLICPHMKIVRYRSDGVLNSSVFVILSISLWVCGWD